MNDSFSKNVTAPRHKNIIYNNYKSFIKKYQIEENKNPNRMSIKSYIYMKGKGKTNDPNTNLTNINTQNNLSGENTINNFNSIITRDSNN